ncbi:TPA: DUF4238 domain-containing protein [Bacillus thuringiensis]|uniref:DUF4238 domain-containing protein n=1 Tax=Bacillus thuringiensis TaxID=1428 RepID=UPI000BFB2030|nr:DUF4238 domain-containing protein [Bacillus thuringiensis]PGS64625.1 hypothetical protein COD07_27335 [Bacillus thuringiensis]HDX9688660.1 DUF4238 domain-containing protein [Bacillus thuringiensis]
MAKKKQVTRNQHIIPQVWLRNFAIKENVFVYDTKKKESMGPRNIEKIGHRPYFYDFPNEVLEHIKFSGIKDWGKQYVEQTFLQQTAENKLGSLFNKLLNKPWAIINNNWITNEEKDELSTQFAIQFFRTETLPQLLTRSIMAINEYDEDKKEYIEKYKSFFQFYYMSSEKLETIANLFLEKNWTIFYNHTDIPFYTSDNPIVIQTEVKFNNICIPISSKLLIVLYDKRIEEISDNKVFHPLECQVKEFNSLQIQQCGWQVFSEKDNFDWIKDEHLVKTGLNGILEEQNPFIKNYAKLFKK